MGEDDAAPVARCSIKLSLMSTISDRILAFSLLFGSSKEEMISVSCDESVKQIHKTSLGIKSTEQNSPLSVSFN
jgi:hypothetical protein